MDYTNVDFATNPYFSPQAGDGMSSLGDMNGGGWFDWGNASLGDIGQSAFTLERGLDDGAYRGTGPSKYNPMYDTGKLTQWMKDRNYSLQEQQQPGWRNARLWDNTANKQVGDVQGMQTAPDWVDNTTFQLAGMFLSPFGGLAAGGAAGGLGGTLAEGTTAQAINGGIGGAMSTAGAGGSDKDILKSGVIGGASPYAPNVGEFVGVTDPTLQTAINNGLAGGVKSAATGGNFWNGAANGALPSLGSYAATALNMDMPDVGTLGGTMQDEYGESSATLGGAATPMQAEANANVATTEQGQSTSLSDKLKKAFGFDGEGGGFGDFSGKQIGNMAQGLAGLYAANKQRRMSKDLMNQIAGRRDAYSTQLQRSLARKDAASGRRSDYAGREVALQSALAQLDSANAPSMMNLQNAQMGGYVDMLKSGLSLGNSFGLFGKTSQPQVPVSYSGQLPSLETSMPADYSLAGPQAQDYYTRGKIKLGGGN